MIVMEKMLHIYKKCKSRWRYKRMRRRKRKRRRKIKRRNKTDKKKAFKANLKMIKLNEKQIFQRAPTRELIPKNKKHFLGKKTLMKRNN